MRIYTKEESEMLEKVLGKKGRIMFENREIFEKMTKIKLDFLVEYEDGTAVRITPYD